MERKRGVPNASIMKILLSSICLETGTDIQLALYYLLSYLSKQRALHTVCPEVAIRVFNENQRISSIVKRIIAFDPHVIGFSCYVWNIEKTLHLCRKLKKINRRLKIVLGGPEVTPRAGEILMQEKAVDIVVRGEGEKTFAELIRSIASADVALSCVKGISFREGKNVMNNPERPQLRNLSIIPSPYLSRQVDLNDKRIVDVPLETMRGCVFRCDYCYYHKNFPVERNFALGRIEKELKLILTHKPHEVYLMDATFNSCPHRAKKILRMFIKHNQGANLHVELRAELLDDEMAQLLSRANAYNIEIGIQSTNQRTLRAIHRPFNREKFERGIRLLNKYKLYYEIQLIDVLPYQSYDDLMKSLDWLYALHPAKVVIFRLAVLAGTTLRESALGYGIAYDPAAPYHARKSSAMSEAQVKRAEKLCYAMDRLYDSQVFQKTLYAFKAKTGIKISTILEDWVVWESRFKKRCAGYPEFLNRKSPVFLEYLCRTHDKMYLYELLLPGLLKNLF